jgi:hypothetical protein
MFNRPRYGYSNQFYGNGLRGYGGNYGGYGGGYGGGGYGGGGMQSSGATTRFCILFFNIKLRLRFILVALVQLQVMVVLEDDNL